MGRREDSRSIDSRVLADCLSRPGADRARAIEQLGEAHPELAVELRRLAELVDDVERAAGGAATMLPNDRARPRPAPRDAVQLDELHARLAGEVARVRAGDRYAVGEEIDRGGMGIVRNVFDRELRRELAMKVLLGGDDAPAGPGGNDPQRTSLRLARFYDEAQITAQLDHPGVVPIHELGMSPEGIFFTMKLVKGETLKRVLDRVAAGEEGWTRTRVLGVFLKVCEAMAYAHAKGVVHRDLKPGNVMVGRFGEVYVMDWGLARVLDAEDRRDIRVRAREVLRTDIVRGDRHHQAATDPGTALVTMDGDVVGTPAYMPPEQAAGRVGEVGPRADVYAVGAMLYHLLAGHMPYVPPGAKVNNYAVWSRVQEGPPAPLAQTARGASPELVAICERAMARDPGARYADMAELADDLRAFLENRVVRAHRTGALPELRKWVGRNRGTAAALAAVLVVLLGSSLVVALLQHRKIAAERRAGDETAAPTLLARLDASWPIHPDQAPAMRAWLDDARDLVSRLPEYERRLASLAERHAAAGRAPAPASAAGAPDPFVVANLEFRRDYLAGPERGYFRDRIEGPDAVAADLAREDLEVLERELEVLDARIEALHRERANHRDWRYVDPDVEREYARLHRLVQRLRRLDGGGIRSVEERLEQAASLASRSLDEPRDLWSLALDSIADPGRCPLYGGLRLPPQLGLVPLRRNDGGLWEFWHVASGDRPELDADDALVIGPDTGLVFVLVPGGRVHVGTQSDDPEGPHYVAPEVFDLHPSEQPTLTVELEPYLLSKYELTQAQWTRLAGDWPSEWYPGARTLASRTVSATHPVESVAWERARDALRRWGLTLPTETQWERAARAGTDGWFAWAEPRELAARLSFADRAAAANGFPGADPSVDDGYAVHGPVDLFPPNPWGLHGMLDNVSEWCLDWFAVDHLDVEVEPGTGRLTPRYSTQKATRGGHFKAPLGELRVTCRYGRPPRGATDELGVRPALALSHQPHGAHP